MTSKTEPQQMQHPITVKVSENSVYFTMAGFTADDGDRHFSGGATANGGGFVVYVREGDRRLSVLLDGRDIARLASEVFDAYMAELEGGDDAPATG